MLLLVFNISLKSEVALVTGQKKKTNIVDVVDRQAKYDNGYAVP